MACFIVSYFDDSQTSRLCSDQKVMFKNAKTLFYSLISALGLLCWGFASPGKFHKYHKRFSKLQRAGENNISRPMIVKYHLNKFFANVTGQL